MQFWLDHPIDITKKMIHQVTSYPMLKKSRLTKTLAWEFLTTKTLTEWDGRGTKLNCVIRQLGQDPILDYEGT